MRRLLAVFLALLLCACANVQRLPTDYSGPDAGKTVVGIGAASGTRYSSYSLLFRRVGQSAAAAEPKEVGRIVFFQTNMFYAQKPDYANSAEQGVVLIQSLPPGDYEIFNFDIFFNAGTVQTNFSSREPFSIPFTVKAGETTYLGNYQANRISGKNILGLPVASGAVFTVTSRLEDDLRIARGKDGMVRADGQDATPSPRRIGNPFFIERP